DELGIAIHLGGVDMGHAGLDAALKRRDRALAVAAVEIPGALPDHGNLGAAFAEGILSHDRLTGPELGPDLRSIVRPCNEASVVTVKHRGYFCCVLVAVILDAFSSREPVPTSLESAF